MTINARGPDGSSFNPARDLRQCYPEVINHVIKKFNTQAWPELMEQTEKAGVGWDELCDAMQSYCEFLSSPKDAREKTMQEQLEAAGWFNYHPMARIAVCAMLGTVLTGQLYYAVCETTPLGAPPHDMVQTMERLRSTLLANK